MSTPPRLVLQLLLACATALPLPAQLAGTYTINPAWPATASNFTGLENAVTALVAQGVSGPVSFELYDDAGPFSGSMPFVTSNVTWGTSDAVLTLAPWPGASAACRVGFRAAPGEKPVLDASGRALGVFWNGADHVTLEGLEIRNADFDAVSLYSEASHGQVLAARILRCRIHGCGGGGIVIHGNLPHPQDTLVEGNFLWDLQLTNAGGFNTLSRFAYITGRRHNGTRIVHNSFLVSSGSGPFFAVIGSVPGSLTDGSFAEVLNNVIVKSVLPQRPLFFFPELGGVSSLPAAQDGNCYHDTSGGPLAFHGVNGQTTSADLAAWSSATGLDPLALLDDPRLASPVLGDLHLLPGSPCVDAAVPGPNPGLDLDGEPRGTSADIGADELTVAGVPVAILVGQGAPAAAGPAPVLTTTQQPNVGNTAFHVSVGSGTAGTQAWLFAAHGLAPVPMPLAGGSLLYLEPVSLQQLYQAGTVPLGPLQVGAAGDVTWPIPLSNDPTLSGLRVVFQAAVQDSSSRLGYVTTNALDVRIN